MIILELIVMYFIVGLVFFAWNLLNYMVGIYGQRGYARKMVKSFCWPVLVKEFIDQIAEDAKR